MSNNPVQDPFYVVKEDVLQSLHGITTLYDSWKQQFEAGNTNSEEFKWTTDELKNGIKSIDWDLTDLEETINIVENNRARFKLEVSEVQTRKNFVLETKRTIAAIKDEVNSTRTKGIIEKNQRDTLMRGPNQRTGKFAKLEEAIEQENEDFVRDHQSKQQMIFREQDDVLDKVSHTVTHLKGISETIGTELKDQEGMITDLGEKIDRADTGLKGMVKKVNHLIDQTSDTKQLILIGVLILVLVGLIVLVIKLPGR